MSIELGSAYISILPETSKLSKEIKGTFKDVERQSATSSKAVGGNLMGAFKKVALVGGGALGAIGFGKLVKDAANATDTMDKFNSTMAFAGFSQKEIDKAGKRTKDYADKTVYDLNTIANTNAQLASNGVKDFNLLTESLGNLNAAAGGNADTFGSLAMVTTQTNAAGKLTTENWNQLAEAVPGAAGPIMKALKESGAYTGDFREAMAKGEITAEEYNAALVKLGQSDAAKKAATSTSTFEGAIGNLQAAIVTALMPALGAIQPIFASVAGWIADKAIPALSDFGGYIKDTLAPIFDDFGKKGGALKGTFSAIQGFVGRVLPTVKQFGEAFIGVAGPAFREISDLIKKQLLPAFNAMLPVIAPIVAFILKVIGQSIIGVFKGAVGIIKGVINVITGIFKTIKAVLTGNWSAAWDGIKQILSGALQAIVGMVTVWFNWGILAVFKHGLKALLGFIRAPLGVMRRIFVSGFKAIGNVARGMWGVVRPVFMGIARVLKTVVVGAFRIFLGIAKSVFKAAGVVIRGVWNGVIKPVFNALKNFLTAVVFPVIKALLNNIIKPIFKTIGTVVKAAWNNVIKPVFQKLGSFINDTVRPAFKRGVDKIKAIWDGLKSAASAPVKFLVNTVYDKGIRKMMNKIPGVNLPSVSFATGGVMPGYTPGRDVHQFYSPTAGRLALSGGEAIMRPEFTRLVGGAAGVNALNAMARKGQLPNLGGYFLGGVIPLPGATSISRHTSGYKSAWAGDLNAPNDYGRPVKAWKSGVVAAMRYIGNRSYGRWVDIQHKGQSSRYAHLSGFGPIAVGMPISAGSTLGYVGSVGNSSGPHLHFEVNGGSVKGGTGPGKTEAQIKGEQKDKKKKKSWLDLITKVPNLAKETWNKIKTMGNSGWAGTFKKAGKEVLRRGVNWADDKIPDKLKLKFLPDVNLPDNPIMSLLKKLGIFDNGGILEPGKFAYNASNKPEAVFNHRQFKSFAESAGNGGDIVLPSHMVLDVDGHQFTAYVRDIAQDTYDSEHEYAESRRRMG